ncbi:MAG: DUF3375 domain-containing protein [Oscillospiraceae bacterium]|nr:DUF3375 domain-containing protein [Oscillospiraceae bacterium]
MKQPIINMNTASVEHMSFAYLEKLRKTNPAWRLLTSTLSPYIASFLFHIFIAEDRRQIAGQELISRLDDFIYEVNRGREVALFTKTGREYLDDWADDQHGWLRKFYLALQDEPHFDITSQVQKALDWLLSLKQQMFIGTESRLRTVFDLLRQIVAGVESDPEQRLIELQRQKDEIDHQMKLISDGKIDVLDETQIRERFWQAMSTAREIVSDFRAVEQNFRELDRELRERISTWDKGKGELLEAIFNEQDGISQSEQGKSFAAFWRFLMSSESQEDFTEILHKVLELEPIQDMGTSKDNRNIHHSWVGAGSHVQETVANLSEQLKNYVDENYIIEEQRINRILREIEGKALKIHNTPPEDWYLEIDDMKPNIILTLDRPLYTSRTKAEIINDVIDVGSESFSADSLYSLVYIDKEKLLSQITYLLHTNDLITISQITAEYPLELGLSELIMYFIIADEKNIITNQTDEYEEVFWEDEDGIIRLAKIPKITFCREKIGE